jgi:hypothetical protein
VARTYSYSIPEEKANEIEIFLKEEARNKDISKASVVVAAIKYYMKARLDEDRQIPKAKKVILPSLSSCSIGAPIGPGEQLQKELKETGKLMTKKEQQLIERKHFQHQNTINYLKQKGTMDELINYCKEREEYEDCSFCDELKKRFEYQKQRTEEWRKDEEDEEEKVPQGQEQRQQDQHTFS